MSYPSHPAASHRAPLPNRSWHTPSPAVGRSPPRNPGRSSGSRRFGQKASSTRSASSTTGQEHNLSIPPDGGGNSRQFMLQESFRHRFFQRFDRPRMKRFYTLHLFRAYFLLQLARPSLGLPKLNIHSLAAVSVKNQNRLLGRRLKHNPMRPTVKSKKLPGSGTRTRSMAPV